jgi:hypothetical protein
MLNNKNIINNIDFNVDYYAILNINKENLYNEDDITNKIINRRKNYKILNKAYKEMACIFHPDLAPTGKVAEYTEKFKSLIKAYTILSDPYLRKIYDNKEIKFINSNNINIDWSLVGKFKKDSLENEVGNIIILSILDRLGKDGKLVFVPDDEKYHNYNWEIEISYCSKNLTLSIVSDDEKILKLTDAKKIENSLPFQIYLYFPNLFFKIEKEEALIVEDSDGTLIKYPGKIKNISYIDYEIFSCTCIDNIIDFIKSDEFNNKLIEYKKCH